MLPVARLALFAALLIFTSDAASLENSAAVVVTDLSYVTPSRLVDLGDGRRMNLHCTGHGSPVVIFESGLGDQIRAWAMVQPDVAKRTRACSYDRAGFGYSDPSGRDGTGANSVDDLHRLLNAAAVPPPYILVGHSLGGMYVRLFAHRYPSEVAGMVLVDSTSEEQARRFWELDPSARTRNEAFVANIRSECIPQAAIGIDKSSDVYATCVGSPDPRFGDEFNEVFLANQSRPEYFQAAWSEWSNAFTVSSDQARAATQGFGDMPLIVLTRTPFPLGTSETQGMRDAKNKLWMELQESLVRLSTVGENVVVPGAGHYIQFDQPAAVTNAILRTWERSSVAGERDMNRGPDD